MAAGNTFQTATTGTEATATVAGASSTLSVDLVTLFSAFLQTQVARQVMVLGDPNLQNAMAAVSGNTFNGNENGLAVKNVPGVSELTLILQELRNIRAELQNIGLGFGFFPATDVVLQSSS